MIGRKLEGWGVGRIHGRKADVEDDCGCLSHQMKLNKKKPKSDGPDYPVIRD